MRIGLIAMSGVRVVNPKLVELGVTLPQFVNRGEVIAQLPSLALLLLAALTPGEDEVEYIEIADISAEGALDTRRDNARNAHAALPSLKFGQPSTDTSAASPRK